MWVQTTFWEIDDAETKKKAEDKKQEIFGIRPLKEQNLGIYQLNSVVHIDCIKGMKNIPDKSVDIVIADPPYNASKGGNWKWDNSVDLPGFGGNWTKVMAEWDDMPLMDYLKFSLEWLAEVKRVVRPSGSIWVHGTYHNIGIINFALQMLEIEIINEVIWYKRNSFPNLSGRRLTASHETIIWAHVGKKREYLFNYEIAKDMICEEDKLKLPGKQMRTVWDIPNNKESEEIKYGKHPTQKPIRLLKRMLELTAKPDQICLVPFAGVGSECIAALKNGMYFIAFETEPEYIAICNKRIEAIVEQQNIYNQSLIKGKEIFVIGREKHGDKKKSHEEIKNDIVDEAFEKMECIPPLIKWTGSKRSQAYKIKSYVPEYKRYFEPFVGSGAVLYLLAKNEAIAGDIYEPLIRLWQIIQNKPEDFINNYREQWDNLQKNLPDYFYEVRDRFNRYQDPMDLNFLLRTCVNGIVRFNEKGEFNNSFHLSRRGMQPDRLEAIVYIWREKLKAVKFVCQDYAKTLDEAEEGDFVYLDPPYLGNKQRYIKNIDMRTFWEKLEDLNEKKVKWALSFDGRRGGRDLSQDIPNELYRRRLMLPSGNSAVGKVLNGPIEMVEESLYLNY